MNVKRFTNLIGKTFLFHGEQHTIKAINPTENDREILRVTTDKRLIKVTEGELRREFLPVKIPVNGAEDQALVRQVDNLLPMDDLASTLIKSLEEINGAQTIEAANKVFARAKVINDTAKTLIQLRKLQLDMLRTARDMK